MSKLAIIGAGSNGLATAAWFVAQDHHVCLCDSAEQFSDLSSIRKQGGILVRGGGRRGLFLPELLTTDFAEAAAFGNLVVFCTSALRHRELIDAFVPLSRPGQTFLFNPGNFGSFLLRRALDIRKVSDVLSADLSGGLWACRRTGPGEVLAAFALTGTKKIAACPAADTPRLMAALRGVLDTSPGANILETTLNSPNAVSHLGGAILNAVRIEQMGRRFVYYLHGLGESVIKVNSVLEAERNQVLDALGLLIYNLSSEAFTRQLMDYDKYPELDNFRSLDGPSAFSHRYVTEDAACGVSMLASLGRRLGIAMPLTEGTLAFANAILGRDFFKEGATLENLGINGTTPQELLNAF